MFKQFFQDNTAYNLEIFHEISNAMSQQNEQTIFIIANILHTNPDFDVNFRPTPRTSLLHKAIEVGDEDIVTLLINEGADVNMSDRLHGTLSMRVLLSGNPNLVDIFYLARANLNNAVLFLADYGTDADVPCLRRVLELRPELLHFKSVTGKTAAEICVDNLKKNTLNIFKTLLKKGIETRGLLHSIIYSHHYYRRHRRNGLLFLRLLIDVRNVDLNERNEAGQTAEETARSLNEIDLVTFFKSEAERRHQEQVRRETLAAITAARRRDDLANLPPEMWREITRFM